MRRSVILAAHLCICLVTNLILQKDKIGSGGRKACFPLINIIMGLELGGDDYLTKPFKLGVLLSRVNALLRRANASSAGEPVLESGSITVRLLQGQAYKNEILLELTGAEYKLLCFFMQHPNAVLSKEQILDALWDCDGDYIDSSALTVYIRRLRMKIEDDPGKPQMLLTVRGMGYKWNG